MAGFGHLNLALKPDSSWALGEVGGEGGSREGDWNTSSRPNPGMFLKTSFSRGSVSLVFPFKAVPKGLPHSEFQTLLPVMKRPFFCWLMLAVSLVLFFCGVLPYIRLSHHSANPPRGLPSRPEMPTPTWTERLSFFSLGARWFGADKLIELPERESVFQGLASQRKKTRCQTRFLQGSCVQPKITPKGN